MGFILPDSKQDCSGWIDHDRGVLNQNLSLRDKAYYLEQRLNKVFFGPMNRVFLNSAPKHKAVNSKEMSFFLLGTTLTCCTIEAVGGFLLGPGRNRESGINGKRFREFLKRYLKNWNKRTKKGTSIPDWLWTHLRNALAHSLSISFGGMAYLGKKRYREQSKGKIEIHAELLYKDFRKAFATYISDLMSNRKRSASGKFEGRFKEVFVDTHT